MKCPKCGAVMREKTGRYGPFLSCSNYPRCNGTRNVTSTENSTSTKPTKPTRRRAGLKVISRRQSITAFDKDNQHRSS